jgi:hypothetical protein
MYIANAIKKSTRQSVKVMTKVSHIMIAVLLNENVDHIGTHDSSACSLLDQFELELENFACC